MTQIALMPDTLPDHDMRRLLMPDVFIASSEGPQPTPALRRHIAQFGVFEPIIVVESTHPLGYRVIEGRRRYIAAKDAGHHDIPAVIVVEGQVNLDALRAAAHALRQDNPQAELRAIENLIRDGHSLPEIAKATGLKLQVIKQRMTLHGLEPRLRAAFDEGRMAVTVAEQAARLPEEIQTRLGGLAADGTKITGKEVKAATFARTQAAALELPFDLMGLPDDLAAIPVAQNVYKSVVDKIRELVEHPDRNRTKTVLAIRDLLKAVPS